MTPLEREMILARLEVRCAEILREASAASPEQAPLAQAAVIDQRLKELAEHAALWERFGRVVNSPDPRQRHGLGAIRTITMVSGQIARDYKKVLPLLDQPGCGREVIERGLHGTPESEQLRIPDETLQRLAAGHAAGQAVLKEFDTLLRKRRADLVGGGGQVQAEPKDRKAPIKIPKKAILVGVCVVLMIISFAMLRAHFAGRPRPPEPSRPPPAVTPEAKTPETPSRQERKELPGSAAADASATMPGLPSAWRARRYQVKAAAPQGTQLRDVTYYANSIGMELAYISPGEFMMGSEVSAEEVARLGGGHGREFSLGDQHPRHKVRITRSFFMGSCEVTVAEFRRFVSETKHRTQAEQGGGARVWTPDGWQTLPKADWTNPGFKSDDRYPVVCVSWNDAQAFCRWLSAKEGVAYRLPTEAEWEYACRAGTTTAFYTGNTLSLDLANYNGAYTYGGGTAGGWRKGPTPAGVFPANAWGLYDMHGNAFEWCQDCFAGDYYGRSPSDDPKGPETGDLRVLRGASWYDGAGRCRSANRDSAPSSRCTNNIGFRVIAAPGEAVPSEAKTGDDAAVKGNP